MQAHYPNGSPYLNMRHAFATIYREGALTATGVQLPALAGIRSLWRGVEPTTIRGIILSTSQICSYDQVKQTLKKQGIMEEGFGLHLTASLFAGLVSKSSSMLSGTDVIVGVATDCSAQSLRIPLVSPRWSVGET